MAQIVLTTLNARYHHTSIALHTLFANLGTLQAEAVIKEFTIKDDPLEMISKIVLEQPVIVGFGVYIWNLTQITTVVTMLKQLYPEIIVVIGGPEVSYDFETLEIFQNCNYLIRGEGEIPLYNLCKEILSGRLPEKKMIGPVLTDPAQLIPPYRYYNEDTLKNRVIYLETSRGCPYRCNFCLSALDQKVRYFPMEMVLDQLNYLWNRGVRQFKFIDRTFNLNIERCETILNFFLTQEEPCFLHFELVPDRLPEKLKVLIEKFPPGSLQFEVGLQSMDENTLERIGRKQHMGKTIENLTYLFEKSGAHIHTDLIVGLPGETLAQFEEGFNQLMRLDPDEIQVGILKKLRGALIKRFDTEFGMIYAQNPPYQILQNSDIPFSEMLWMIRFAKYWDLYYNNGYFKRSIRLIFDQNSYFQPFMKLTQYTFDQFGRTHSIALNNLAETLFNFLVKEGKNPVDIAQKMGYDLLHTQKRKTPPFLKPFINDINRYIDDQTADLTTTTLNSVQPGRQQRH